MKRIISTSVLCLAVGLVASGCGGSDGDAAASGSQAQAQGQAPGSGRGPGGSGEVAEVSGSTAQVTGQDAQVAVSWTDSTTFTQQVSASASDVTVGSCVMVTSAADGAGSTDAVAASTVQITEKTDGSCSVMGAGGGPGGGGERPTDMPTDMPTDGAGGRGGPGGGFAVGEVTAVSDTGFTVLSQLPGADGSTASPTTVTVTTSGDTTYSTTADASAEDVTVGVCVTSRGEADDTGAITAESIAITQPVDGACVMGFGGGRPADAS
ncbi:hypothetical protein AERO_09505 [Aeromicrobium fastidiosum]|uniref:hypothetical protein n=1 Tax=Aeromicrobium fastidiosum TaxID=52699 RepID=UPI0020238A72|nr:hypothetical protein [Aeromicrobium fastidiosum]MCL8251616.1 hypothetical protein [Aeromicrobium fastidiosum]